MHLLVIGLNHKTAPIEIRECLAFQEDRLEEALKQVHALPSLNEAMIVSTCNRVEIYASVSESEKAARELKGFLSNAQGLPLGKFENHLYYYTGEEAVRHIFRVASSLDSMVVGEPQILGQIKSAYELSRQAKTSGIVLHRLLHRAFHTAKRVRTETKISISPVSISSIAVELAEKIFETLRGKTVLLVGAGEMCELAARHLVSAGADNILVTNRTYDRALQMVRKFQGKAIPFEDVVQGLKKADIVISATHSQHYVIEHQQMIRVMRDRKQSPIFFIDIADPRDIEPGVGDIENVYLYNLDDLQTVAAENIRDRKKEAEKAEDIVKEEVARFTGWYRALDVTPTIVGLKKKFEIIRRGELEKMLLRHPHLSRKEKESLEALTTAIVKKILHQPLTLLKQMDGEVLSDLYLDALQTLFGLSEKQRSEKHERENVKKNG